LIDGINKLVVGLENQKSLLIIVLRVANGWCGCISWTLSVDFLLFSNATKGKPPQYVGREAGLFPFASSSNEGDTEEEEHPGASGRKRKLGAGTMVASSSNKKLFDDRTNKLASLMEEMTTVLKAHAPYITPGGGSEHDMLSNRLLQAILFC
jgi:hypothetical protein